GLELRGFAGPARQPAAARLDIARTVCRRAERRLCTLSRETRADLRTEARAEARALRYLNRLSDLLFLLVRLED
ncbi:MAG: ATP:cob(I)alamin adenosyltransferase, partial [Treponema sp.]|nr:ATP:cob(I)alamin adenosyltransferase [Treponema sp.]